MGAYDRASLTFNGLNALPPAAFEPCAGDAEPAVFGDCDVWRDPNGDGREMNGDWPDVLAVAGAAGAGAGAALDAAGADVDVDVAGVVAGTAGAPDVGGAPDMVTCRARD